MVSDDRWFKLPLEEIDSADVPNGISPGPRPKYVENAESVQSEPIPDSDRALALVSAPEDVLNEIADKDDVEELNEVTANKLHHIISNSKDNSNFQPVSPGEGESSEERLKDVIENLREGLVVGDEGVTVAEPTMEIGDRLFLDSPVILKDFEEVVELGRQLYDLMLQPPAPVIPMEQREFLDTISNLVQYADTETNIFEGMMKDDLIDGPGLKGLILDFNQMMDYILIHDRMSGADQRVKQFIQSYTGVTGPESIIIPFGLFGPTSLAMLDGFVKYRCPEIDIETGDYRKGMVEKSWRPNSPQEASMTYHDRLQFWRTNIAGEKVKESLDIINDLSRYDESNLRNLAGIMGNDEILEREKDSTGHFLAVLSEQRNFSIHGQGSSRIIAPLALNLSILVLLDAIGEERYPDLVEEFLRSQRN